MFKEGYAPYDNPGAVQHYIQNYSGFWNEYPRDIVENFVCSVKNVPNGSGLVLCVGSGSGDEAQILTDLGIRPICLDGAFEMVKESKRRGFCSVRGVFQQLPFAKVFDGVWAYKSLNHSASLEELKCSLVGIRRALKYQGAFGLCMLKGKTDEINDSHFDGKATRKNLYLREDTFLSLLENHGFAVEVYANFRRGHTDYLIANAVNFSRD